jgi:hypothetical protein
MRRMVKRSRIKSLGFEGHSTGVEESPKSKSANTSDVPDSQRFQAFVAPESEGFSAFPQGLVNHVSQGLVNHAGG